MTPTEKPKRKKKTKQYHVLKDGVPCCYGHGGCFSLKQGVLIPCSPNASPHVFGGESSAGAAIDRTNAIHLRMKGTLLDDWDKFADLMTPGKFEIKYIQPVA